MIVKSRPKGSPVTRFCLAVAFAFLIAAPAGAGPVLTFEAFGDSEVLTNQIPGLTFIGAQVASAGLSLNEFELPPRSGANVAVDLGGSFRIDFASPVPSFSAYFTYFLPLTLQAHDASNNLLSSVSTAFTSNAAISGDPGSQPNELLKVQAANIAYVTITGGDPAGNSFAFDDASAVPEPAAVSLLLVGSALLRIVRRKTT